MDRQPPPDLSLAVGHGARRMTYVELAAVRGISLGSARRLVLRHRWPRQTGNDGIVRVTVPLTAIQKSSTAASSDETIRPMSDAGSVITTASPGPPTDSRTVAPATDAVTVTLTKAVDALCDQLAKAERRADNAEQRIGELAANLADAVGAERITAGDAAALRAELDRRRSWRLFRRLLWALRGDRVSRDSSR
jgi:hypothetical protein